MYTTPNDATSHLDVLFLLLFLCFKTWLVSAGFQGGGFIEASIDLEGPTDTLDAVFGCRGAFAHMSVQL